VGSEFQPEVLKITLRSVGLNSFSFVWYTHHSFSDILATDKQKWSFTGDLGPKGFAPVSPSETYNGNSTKAVATSYVWSSRNKTIDLIKVLPSSLLSPHSSSPSPFIPSRSSSLSPLTLYLLTPSPSPSSKGSPRGSSLCLPRPHPRHPLPLLGAKSLAVRVHRNRTRPVPSYPLG
jgi:hypothetical protein